MGTYKISLWQYTMMIIAFVLGTALIVSIGGPAGKDAWAVIILGAIEGILLSLPLLLLSTRFYGMGISSINNMVWGKHIGKILSIAFISYTLLLSTRAAYNFFNFVKLVLLSGAPDYAIDVPTLTVIGLACLLGIEVIGRFVSITTPIVISFIVFILLLSVPYIDPNNIRPVFQTPLPKALSTAHSVATFPFAEVTLFSAIIPFLDKPQKAIKATLLGVIVTMVIFLLVFFRNIGVLGEASSYFQYPSFTSARIINLGGVFTRMEILVSINLTLLGGIKTATLLYIASLTTTEMLNLKSTKPVVIPFAIVVAVINHNNYPSVAHAHVFLQDIYPVFSLPFLFVLPLLTLVVAIVSKKSAGNNESLQASDNYC